MQLPLVISVHHQTTSQMDLQVIKLHQSLKKDPQTTTLLSAQRLLTEVSMKILWSFKNKTNPTLKYSQARTVSHISFCKYHWRAVTNKMLPHLNDNHYKMTLKIFAIANIYFLSGNGWKNWIRWKSGCSPGTGNNEWYVLLFFESSPLIP